MKKSYLEKSALYPAIIHDPPSEQLEMVIVIPAYDEPGLLSTLQSLQACQKPPCDTEVIIVINYPEIANEPLRDHSLQQYEWLKEWAVQHQEDWLSYYPLLLSDLPQKKAGVGLARKIGLDEGVRRLIQSRGRTNDPKGILVCFDADSQCRSDYLIQIHRYFEEQPNMDALSIGYAHPLDGDEFTQAVYQSIATYELHLRYFLLAKKLAGCSHAIETIGSAMAVRQWAYQQQGGMNQRKAGEDFYFLHKFIATGRTGELLEPLVIPSPRVSHRVPFGTGKAVGDLLENKQPLETYALPVFLDLQQFIGQFDALYHLPLSEVSAFLSQQPPLIQAFFPTQSFLERLTEIRSNTSDLSSFRKRLFRWLDAFRVMKYVHFARDHFYPNVPVDLAALGLLQHFYPDLLPEKKDVKSLLNVYRKLAYKKKLP